MGTGESKHHGRGGASGGGAGATKKRSTPRSVFQPEQLLYIDSAWKHMHPDANNTIAPDALQTYLELPDQLSKFADRLQRTWATSSASPPPTTTAKSKPNGHSSGGDDNEGVRLHYDDFLLGLERSYKTSTTSDQLESLGVMYADKASGTLGQEQLMMLCTDLACLASYCSEYEEANFMPQQQSQPSQSPLPSQPQSPSTNGGSGDGSKDNTVAGAEESGDSDKDKKVDAGDDDGEDAGDDENDKKRKKGDGASKYAKLNIQVPTVKGGVSVNPMNEPSAAAIEAANASERTQEEIEEANQQAQIASDIRITRSIIRGLLAAAWDFGDNPPRDSTSSSSSSSTSSKPPSLTPSQLSDWALECVPSLSQPLENLLHLRFFMPPQYTEDQRKIHKPVAIHAVGINMEKSALFGRGFLWMLDLLFDDRRSVWRLLYSSYSHGHSLNRLVHHVVGYDGPTVTLIRTKDGNLLGAYLNTPWQTVPKFIGDSSSFLFCLSPKVVVRRPTGVEKNFAYLYDKKGSFSGYPVGLGFGGTTANAAFRLHLDEDLSAGIVRQLDSTYQSGPLLPHPAFEVELIEVWGCGGSAAELAHARAQNLKSKMAERARKVNRKQAASGWSSGPDKFIMDLLGKTGSSDEFIDEVNAAKKKVAAAKKKQQQAHNPEEG